MRTCYWPRAIIHIYMDTFLASIEQRDFPELRGRPIGITHGVIAPEMAPVFPAPPPSRRPFPTAPYLAHPWARMAVDSTVTACSYQAHAAGVETGMRLWEARRLCPNIILRPARPQAYAAVSTALMHAFADLSPDVEVLSMDEMFIDVTHGQGPHGAPEHMACMVKERVHDATRGLPCSVGVAADRGTAQAASGMGRPGGLTVIPPWEARERLRHLSIENIRGIGPRIRAFLWQYGARTCGDVAAMPVDLLVRRYGVTGKQVWLMCQGRDTASVVQEVASPKSVGHGKVLPPRTVSQRTLLTYVRHMCKKLAARLRHCDMQAGRLYVGLRYAHDDGIGANAPARDGVSARNTGATSSAPGNGIAEILVLPQAVPDGKDYFGRAQAFLEQHWQGQPVTHIQITATHLCNASGQLELFSPDEVGALHWFSARDRINAGEFTLAPTMLVQPLAAPILI